MKKGASLIALFICLSAYCQTPNFNQVDRYAARTGYAFPKQLASQLTSVYADDLFKVRSVFYWITTHIEYQHAGSYNRNNIVWNGEEDFETLDERVGVQVIQRGYAICDGYSRLFKILCHYAGIQAETISGYGNGGHQFRKFSNNHTWNAVKINGEWKLLDVTWAAGYFTDPGGVYVQRTDDRYFLTAPEIFAKDHFPDDINWLLQKELPLIPEMSYSPFRQKTFSRYSIHNYTPAEGLLHVRPGDTIHFRIDVKDPLRDRTVGTDPFIDTIQFDESQAVVLIPSQSSSTYLSYSYVVGMNPAQWVYIQYNRDLVLRYRLRLRK